MMWGGGFPEPLTFSVRALRMLRARTADFNVVHDNQGLGYGMLGVRRLGLPLVTSIHHPISVDRRIDLASTGWPRGLSKRRSLRVHPDAGPGGAPVAGPDRDHRIGMSKRDMCRDFRVPPDRVHIVPLGVDTRMFRPREAPRVPGRIIAVAVSADSALKGLATLLRAVGKLATDRDVHLVIVGKPVPATERLAAKLSLSDRITFTHGLDDEAFSSLLASAETAVVPSLYEGFSLPAVEHLASGTPLVASRTGALPEVTGDAAVLVTPGDDEELAAVLRRLHDSRAERFVLADRALDRVGERFAWSAVARATVEQYLAAMGAGVLTVDFRRFPVRPGHRVLDLGCGGGRHAFEVYRRGGRVVAYDLDPAELGPVRSMFGAMREAGEAGGRPVRRRLPVTPGGCHSATALPVYHALRLTIQALARPAAKRSR